MRMIGVYPAVRFIYAVSGAVLSSLLLITSCSLSIPPPPEDNPGAALKPAQTAVLTEAPSQLTKVKTPSPTQESIPSERQTPLLLPEGFTVEEYELYERPTSAKLHFTPTQGSSIEILSQRYSERHERFQDNSFLDDNRMRGLRTKIREDFLEARQHLNQTGSESWVILTRNDEEVYRIEVVSGGALDPLIGLWVYDDHWILEAALITPDGPVGRIIRDGVLLNDLYGYEEMFGFQLMAGRPFFFFEQDGKIGFSFNGEVVEADYEEVPHYVCCGLAQLNPVAARNMVAFFAQREGLWYYVEAGVYCCND